MAMANICKTAHLTHYRLKMNLSSTDSFGNSTKESDENKREPGRPKNDPGEPRRTGAQGETQREPRTLGNKAKG